MLGTPSLRGTDPIEGDRGGVVRFEKILEAFELSQQPILDGLDEISDAELGTTVPWFGDQAPKSEALGACEASGLRSLWHLFWHLFWR